LTIWPKLASLSHYSDSAMTGFASFLDPHPPIAPRAMDPTADCAARHGSVLGTPSAAGDTLPLASSPCCNLAYCHCLSCPLSRPQSRVLRGCSRGL